LGVDVSHLQSFKAETCKNFENFI